MIKWAKKKEKVTNWVYVIKFHIKTIMYKFGRKKKNSSRYVYLSLIV